MFNLCSDLTLPALPELDREACSSSAQSDLWPQPGSKIRTALCTNQMLSLVIVKCLLTKLQGWDPAPGRHKILLSRHLEVWGAGRVIRDDHVNIPSQHGLPQLLLRGKKRFSFTTLHLHISFPISKFVYLLYSHCVIFNMPMCHIILKRDFKEVLSIVGKLLSRIQLSSPAPVQMNPIPLKKEKRIWN